MSARVSTRSQRDLLDHREDAGDPLDRRTDELYAAVAAVPDPEVPVISIADLGILRDVAIEDDRAVVTITPTYSGCPAMDAIRDDVLAACAGAGWPDAEVRLVLSPAWTTDWMTEEGRQQLRDYGIAPPGPAGGPVFIGIDDLLRGPAAARVACPQCGSERTRELSRFGSTACKALWSCEDCREPFDHFKPL